MFHSNTELLIDYWRAKKGGARALARSDVDPAEIAPLLPQVFIVRRTPGGGFRLRLAGQHIVDAHGGARAGDDFLAFWQAEDRFALRRALDDALARGRPLVVQARTIGERGRPIALELAFAPLAADGAAADRFLGLYQILPGGTGGVRFAAPLGLREIDGQARAPAPRLRLAALDGRRIA